MAGRGKTPVSRWNAMGRKSWAQKSGPEDQQWKWAGRSVSFQWMEEQNIGVLGRKNKGQLRLLKRRRGWPALVPDGGGGQRGLHCRLLPAVSGVGQEEKNGTERFLFPPAGKSVGLRALLGTRPCVLRKDLRISKEKLAAPSTGGLGKS
ncbi:hypothetical protein KSP40_PGU020991 [Platanthera guangdongensis]|uniref:Uncharacterized protein n=1 Tax=Platanthera guangdongensis TaxID=2320717 RepID=A0ABR2MUC6_9ASPA